MGARLAAYPYNTHLAFFDSTQLSYCSRWAGGVASASERFAKSCRDSERHLDWIAEIRKDAQRIESFTPA
jgi:hypothetical protein